MATPIDDLVNEITSAVRSYTEDVTKGIEDEVEKTSKNVTRAISANSPKKTGEYRKGWTRKKVTAGSGVHYVVYNKNKANVTHLLENGHAKRGGGRVAGIPHIRPVVDRELPAMVDRIKSVIRNGG